MASYFQSPLGMNHIPNFVKAKSPQGLRHALFRNNKKHKAFVVYQDIQFVSGEWVAWFYVTEDVELCFNLIAHGYNTVTIPELIAYHKSSPIIPRLSLSR